MKAFDLISDLKIGSIVEVAGTKVRAEVCGDVTELTRTYDGRVYPIGQIGSVVKIHFGRRIVFGFVTLLRMRSEELLEIAKPLPNDADQRVMEIELFAEGVWDSTRNKLKFSRGVTTYPLPHQGVYLLTRQETVELYKSAEGQQGLRGYDPLVPFGFYIGADNAPCRANIDKMFGMHCAVLGSTGSGKSGAVAAIIHSLLEHKPFGAELCKPNIIIIDPHGEYKSAFGDRAIVYRAYDPIGHEDSEGIPVYLPYWLMSAEEFRTLLIAKTEFEATSQNNIVYKALTHARMVKADLIESAPKGYGGAAPKDGLPLDEPRPKPGVEVETIIQFDRDKPRPFSLDEFQNHILFLQAARTDKAGNLERVPESEFAKNFKSILDKLNVLRRDPRINFLMKKTADEISLASILNQFVGNSVIHNGESCDIRIIDISGLPNEVAGPLSAMLSRLLFQYKLYQNKEERQHDPILLICEEAHRYVPNRGEAEYAVAQSAIRRIAREGRKYGIGLMLVSQRPADVESTVISQCGTWVVLRLTNSTDQEHVTRFLPDGLSGMTKCLSTLAQQEAIFVGEGASLPARIKIRDLPVSKLPQSNTAKFAQGWVQDPLPEEKIATIAFRMAN